MDTNCPICYDTYNDKDKIPRILPCGHTFCQICLLDLRTSNILTCPTCRKFFTPEVKQLIKNFTILDYIYNKKSIDQMGGVCPSLHGNNSQSNAGLRSGQHEDEREESFVDKFCIKHPQKKTKYFCENCQTYICSKCVVGEHKGHQISDHLVEPHQKVDPFVKKRNTL